MNFRVDNLQYCNWSREIFQINHDAKLDALHATICYHEDFDELQVNIRQWNKFFKENSDLIFQGKNSSDIKRSSILSIFPFFIFGFIAMGIVRTIGDYGVENSGMAFMYLDQSMWLTTIHLIKTSAEYLLAIAMAAVGLSTNIASLRSLGIKPLYVGFITALSVGIFSILTIYLIKILGIGI